MRHNYRENEDYRGSVQVKIVQWLGVPIFADGPGDPLDQFLAIGPHPLCITFYLLMVGHIHRNLVSGFAIIYLDGLQNPTIILRNHSTIARFRRR